jgi:hypothetical protein
MSEAKPPDANPWPRLWYGGLTFAGLVFATMGFMALPPWRGSLVVAEAVAPVQVTDELVHETSGRWGSATYRRQNIAVSGGGRGHLIVSPPRTLWVPDLDRLERGTKVRFLIDPGTRIVYEATLGGRVLLSYDASAAQRRSGALVGLGLGSVLLVVGGLGLWRRLRPRPQETPARSPLAGVSPHAAPGRPPEPNGPVGGWKGVCSGTELSGSGFPCAGPPVPPLAGQLTHVAPLTRRFFFGQVALRKARGVRVVLPLHG